jgi:hypothetical protein
MKPSIARYATLQFQPHPNRTEHLNYGIVTFLPEGGVRVHIAASLKKLKAIDPETDLLSIRAQEQEIPQMIKDASLPKALALLNALRVLRGVAESDLGYFSFASDAHYTKQVHLALNAQCEAPMPPSREREPKSRLFVDVRSRFRMLGILAKERDALPDHQVVEQYVPDQGVDVKVEFALQNGLLRIAQTVDLRADTRESVSAQHRQSAYSKAYALHYARTALLESSMQSYVIVAGAHTDPARKVMAAIEKDVDHVLEWESRSDMERFFGEWASAAGRPLPSIPFQ